MEATNTSLDEIMNQINRQNGLDALLNAREALERAIREINSQHQHVPDRRKRHDACQGPELDDQPPGRQPALQLPP